MGCKRKLFGMESFLNDHSNGPLSILHEPLEKFDDGANRSRNDFHLARSVSAAAWISLGM
jgi:hypothetical protein